MDGLYSVLEVSVVEHIDIETIAAGLYADNDMTVIACQLFYLATIVCNISRMAV